MRGTAVMQNIRASSEAKKNERTSAKGMNIMHSADIQKEFMERSGQRLEDCPGLFGQRGSLGRMNPFHPQGWDSVKREESKKINRSREGKGG